MKLGIIARNVNNGGSGRYINKLISEISKIKDKDLRVYLFTNNASYKFNKNVKVIKSKITNKLLFDLVYLPLEIKKHKLDCVIYPKQIIPITHRLINTKKVVVMHDMIYFDKRFKDEWSWKDNLYMNLFTNQTLKMADKVICVSNFTKESIKNLFEVEDRKMKVVHESVDKDLFKRLARKEVLNLTKRFDLNKPFLFYCGSLSKRKNFKRILEAFKSISKDYNHDLVISSWLVNNRELKNIKGYPELRDRIKFLGFVNEKELVALYNQCSIYLYPSLYEGFGLPVLEAQACGCPVITSDVSSMPEIAGKGALLVDPYKSEDISEAIKEVLDEKELRIQLIKKGRANLKRFSWANCARDIIKICHDITYEK